MSGALADENIKKRSDPTMAVLKPPIASQTPAMDSVSKIIYH